MAVDVEPTAPPTAPDGGAPDPVRPGAPSRPGWPVKRIAAGVAALAALAAVLVFTGGADEAPTDGAATEDAAPQDPPADAVPRLAGELEDGYVAFTEPESGISLQHPESWVPLRRPEGTQRLLLSTGGDSTFSVRAEPLDGVGVVDTPEELAQVQAVTDRLAGPEGVQVVNREAIESNGMLGIGYLARFTDEASGTKVANAHYFFFEGETMYILLFQVAPEENFEGLAPDFDKVLASFQVPQVEVTPPPEQPEG